MSLNQQFGYFDIHLDFALWCLVKDGLVTPPFIHHASFKGELQRIGFSEYVWHEWAYEISVTHKPTLSDLPAATASVWRGFPDLKQALVKEWEIYQQAAQQRSSLFEQKVLALGKVSSLIQLRLCLSNIHQVVFVHYPTAVKYLPSQFEVLGLAADLDKEPASDYLGLLKEAIQDYQPKDYWKARRAVELP
ncbi:hypothetical protein H6F43_04130 [Leptolyngbya sp. FACHB-36]|uniref:hypothetical protein n=1 Tax=Leptolyngbya sp. FACHB-36 TaxID=2692808 RepID=UPI0016802246|nr:hypothetical protein [Leptolyngbya sp. FACHB-36]MBD2019371.1 hypothetical protein [Leptolyngbya sp. FACHB-36]